VFGRFGDHILGSEPASDTGRCGGRGDSGASSGISTIGGSTGTRGGGAGIAGALDLDRSQSNGPGDGSLAVAGARCSGAARLSGILVVSGMRGRSDVNGGSSTSWDGSAG
jgi:hypothetical protein